MHRYTIKSSSVSGLPAPAESQSSRPQLRWSVGSGGTQGWATERWPPVRDISCLNASRMKLWICFLRVISHWPKCARASFYYCVWSVLAVCWWTEGEVTALTGRLSFVETFREGAAMHLTPTCRHGRIHTHTRTHRLFSLLLNSGKPPRSENTI